MENLIEKNLGTISAILNGIDRVFQFSNKRNAIRMALKSELEWNLRVLSHLPRTKKLSIEKYDEMISKLKNNELDAFIKFPSPEFFKFNKSITLDILMPFKDKQLRTPKEGVKFIELCRRIRDNIEYRQNDNKPNRPMEVLVNLQTYIKIANRMLK